MTTTVKRLIDNHCKGLCTEIDMIDTQNAGVLQKQESFEP